MAAGSSAPCKAPGVLLDNYETDIPEGAKDLGSNGSAATTSAGIVTHLVVGIGEGNLARMDRLWVDDIEVPLVRDPGGYWRSDPAGYDDRISDIQAQLDALGYNPNLGARTQAELYSPLIFDLLDELEALTVAQGGEDRDRWLYKLTDGGETSTVRMYTDLGSGASGADARLAGIEDAANWNDASGLNLQKMSWAVVELSSWEDGPAWNLALPNIQVRATGALGSNPASIASWYLTTHCGLTEQDLEGVAAAEAACSEEITIQPVFRGDDQLDRLVHASDVLDILYPGGGLPSAANQDAALDAWNSMFAGNANAQPRYQCHRVLTSAAMQDPETLLAQLGRAMGGWIVAVGSKYKFVAGVATDPIDSILEHEIVGELVTWNTSTGAEQKVNAIRATLAQDRDNSYDAFEIASTVNRAIPEQAGYREASYRRDPVPDLGDRGPAPPEP